MRRILLPGAFAAALLLGAGTTGAMPASTTIPAPSTASAAIEDATAPVIQVGHRHYRGRGYRGRGNYGRGYLGRGNLGRGYYGRGYDGRDYDGRGYRDRPYRRGYARGYRRGYRHGYYGPRRRHYRPRIVVRPPPFYYGSGYYGPAYVPYGYGYGSGFSGSVTIGGPRVQSTFFFD